MEQNTDIIEEYFSKLPDVVQECITSKEWQRRVAEIVSKYSLGGKSGSLQYEILFVVTGIESEEDLVENLKRELNISSLLAEQLSRDINQRLLEWIDKSYESSKTIKKEVVSDLVINKPIVDAKKNIPEIRPNITPMVEEGESIKVVEPPKTVAKHQQINNTEATQQVLEPGVRINYKPKDFVEEPVQKLAHVPRFGFTPINNSIEKPNENKIVNTTNNVSTPPKPTPPIPTPPKAEEKPVHKYVSDPYRESLE